MLFGNILQFFNAHSRALLEAQCYILVYFYKTWCWKCFIRDAKYSIHYLWLKK